MIGAVEVDSARNVEISFEQSFKVAKNNVEGMSAVRKKSSGVVSKFIAVERNLNGTNFALREDLNDGIVEQITVGDDKSLIVAGMTFGKLIKRIG